MGTTPAHAGTTKPGSRSPDSPRDHPRARGDHLRTTAVRVAVTGPPPRARGPRRQTARHLLQAGTTPVCAGTTARPSTGPSPGGDHPRVRGDHSGSVSQMARMLGPPPRARGPPAARCRPARPGRDHPRVRGDHAPSCSTVFSPLGPPPRARGPPFVTWGFRWRGGGFYYVVEKPTYLAFPGIVAMCVVRLMSFCPLLLSSSPLRWKVCGSAFRGVVPGVWCACPAPRAVFWRGSDGFEEVAEVGDVGFDGGDFVRGGGGGLAAGGVCVVAGAPEAVGEGLRRAWAAAVGAFDQ